MRETKVKHAFKKAMWRLGFEIHRLLPDGAPRMLVQPIPLVASWLDRLLYLQRMYERMRHVPGATKAIDEYFATRPESIAHDASSGKYHVVKG